MENEEKIKGRPEKQADTAYKQKDFKKDEVVVEIKDLKKRAEKY